MIAFIDVHRDQSGVEFICRVLRAANYRIPHLTQVSSAKTPVPSDRAIRDEQRGSERR